MWYLSLRSLLILCFSFFLPSCGYKLVGQPTFLAPEWKTIYLPPWKNFSGEPRFGELLASELRKKIAQDGFIRPVYSAEEADLILKGEVLRVYFEPVAHATFLQTRTRNIHFEGRYSLLEGKTGKKIYENPKIVRFETYRVTQTGTNLLDPGKEEAIRLIVKDLVELILQDLYLH